MVRVYSFELYDRKPDSLPDETGCSNKKQVVLPSLCRINPDISEETVLAMVNDLCKPNV